MTEGLPERPWCPVREGPNVAPMWTRAPLVAPRGGPGSLADKVFAEPVRRRSVHRATEESTSAGSVPVPVTRPGDAIEQEAELVAQQVATHDPASGTTVPAAAALPRVAATIAPPPLPPPLDAALVGGSAWSAADRAPVEAAMGSDLSAITVHTGEAAAIAAAAIGARAFTVGSSVVLGAGESPSDLLLMAHEATHVLQGASGPIRRDESGSTPAVEDDSILPDWLRDSINSAVRAIPGYTIASVAVGQDLLSGQAITGTPEQQLEQVLAAGPFGAGVSAVLQSCQVIGEIVGLVRGALANHNLTMARVTADLGRAWDEVSVLDGIDPNVAIVARYVNAFVADVVAAASEIADAVIALVRAAIVDLVEPLVTSSALAPVWQLFCKVVHHDPLRDVDVPATTVEILTDFLHLIGKDEALERMTENGTLQRTADWIDTQLGTFFSLLGSARQLFVDAWAAISPENLVELPDTLPGLVDRATSLVRGIVDFGTTLVITIVEFIKDALLSHLSSWARGTRGFPLFTVVLGRDPFTGEEVPRTAEAIIGGFIRLMPGGEQTFQQLSESGVIAQAGARIETAMTELGISWEMVTGLFRAIWDELSLADLVNPIGCFVRIIGQFGEPLGRLVTFAGVVVRTVVELILQAMHFPGELLGQIVAGVQQAVDDISADPVRFLNTLIAALKNGFLGFLDNIATHLVAGLTAWLFRGLSSLGITIPTEVTGESILGLVADVLGLSVDLLWERLAAQIGQERVEAIRGALDRLTGAWAFISDVQQRGFPAIWDFVSGQLSNLWDMVLSAAEEWIMTTIVNRAIAKVLSMLDPTGVMAVINSAIAFFNAVQSVIEYATDILQIVKRYVDTIAAIAQGNAGPGAVQVEGGLAAAVPVAIGFLANQVGLGSIPEKLVEIITGLRELVVQAIDWVITQALRIGQAVLNALGMGSDPAAEPETPAGDDNLDLVVAPAPFSMDGAGHTLSIGEPSSTSPTIVMASVPGSLVGKIDTAAATPGLSDVAVQQQLQAHRVALVAIEAEMAAIMTMMHAPMAPGGTPRRATELVSSPALGYSGTYRGYGPALASKLRTIAGELRQLGDAHKLKGLDGRMHSSVDVGDDGQLLPAYRDRVPWRRRYYKEVRASDKEAVRQDAYVDGHKDASAVQNPTGADSATAKIYRCASCGQLFIDEGGLTASTLTSRKLEVDHDMTVVEHWMTIGRGSRQEVRIEWSEETDNLQPMCRACNRGGNPQRLGNHTVDATFAGPDDP